MHRQNGMSDLQPVDRNVNGFNAHVEEVLLN